MADSVTISKETSPLPEYLDFTKLREEGINHIIDLGKDLWTDFNLHDPGITILEILCYALTDLGYRTNFAIEEVVARSKEQQTADEALSTDREDRKPYNDNFFTPEQILTCNPVTLSDLRRLLIDIPGVRNAFITSAQDNEIPFYVNSDARKLQYEIPDNASDRTNCKIQLRGLYNVFLELEEALQENQCGEKYIDKGNILEQVHQTLHAHRNLCEDFLGVQVLGDENILLCANIELKPDADATEILAQIFIEVQEFLSPTLRFYSLQELLAKDKRIEDIYAGRPLALNNSHGFIDVKQLEQTAPKPVIYVSDLYNVILNIDGVLGVRDLQLTNYINGIAYTRGESWCLPLTDGYRPTLDFDNAQISFVKGPLPQGANRQTAIQQYREERLARTKAKLKPEQLDIAIKEGQYRDIQDYLSIQYEFPNVYGIADVGLRPSDPIERRIKAEQLQAYLFFFDQILVNFLAQLANVRELFSFRSDASTHRIANSKNRTYFTQLISEVPGAKELIRNVYNCAGNEQDSNEPEDYEEYLNWITEDASTYNTRRNLFLDHLLSRFAESFSEYVLLMFDVNGERVNEEAFIEDKSRFLNDYPEISRDRGKGFQYAFLSSSPDPSSPAQSTIWDTYNVSGFKHRVSRLLGIKDITRRTLSHCLIDRVDRGWAFAIQDTKNLCNNDEKLLQSQRVFDSESEAKNEGHRVLALSEDSRTIERLTFQAISFRSGENTATLPEEYGFQIRDPETLEVLAYSCRFTSTDGLEEALAELSRIAAFCDIECTTTQIKECFHYQVWRIGPFQDKSILFVSAQGYESKQAAEDSLKDEFWDTVLLFDRYQNIEPNSNSTGFGFQLVNSQDDVIAYHPCEAPYPDPECIEDCSETQSPPERATCDVQGYSPGVGFKIEERDGKLLFVQHEPAPTKEEAILQSKRTVGLAAYRKYYQTLDQCSSEKPFGFRLLDRDNTPIADHPPCYTTDCARDLAMDCIIHLFCDADAVRFDVDPFVDQFRLVLLSPYDSQTRLLEGTTLYATQGEAELAINTFINIASDPSNYLDVQSTSQNTPYTFIILDESDDPFAIHPTNYELEMERDMAKQSILSYVTPADISISHPNVEGRILCRQCRMKRVLFCYDSAQSSYK